MAKDSSPPPTSKTNVIPFPREQTKLVSGSVQVQSLEEDLRRDQELEKRLSFQQIQGGALQDRPKKILSLDTRLKKKTLFWMLLIFVILKVLFFRL